MVEDNNNEYFTLQIFIQYVTENFVGLMLLALTFFIIYFVDYISRINALIFAMPSPIPGIPNSPVTNLQKKTKKTKKR